MSAAHASEIAQIRLALDSLEQSRRSAQAVSESQDLPPEITSAASSLVVKLDGIIATLEKRLDALHRSLEMGVP